MEENALIEARFAALIEGYLASNHRKHTGIIERAFAFARRAHEGIRRRSGEPYILHPLEVAQIVSRDIGLGSTSICAALLHDVVEDTDATIEDIRHLFGDKIAQLVEGLTKISGGVFADRASLQADNIRHLLLTMCADIRVMIIKMADRLHNMRTLDALAPDKRHKIASETMYIYAPLAHRLGLFSIKTELEDLSFKYEHPHAYNNIAAQVRESEERRNHLYSDFSRPVKDLLDNMGIRYTAKARVKSVYSIWRKMQAKQIPFSEVFDLYAMRIIFDCDNPADEKGICMRIYGAITDLYDPHPDRFRDWVSTPKGNGYQALHCTVMGPDGNWVEIQIRSRRMDDIAERGFAAHWKYKDGTPSDEEKRLSDWMNTIQAILENPNPDDLDLFDTLKLNLCAHEIGVFTPKGELLTLPNNATVLDMAYTLHSEIGNHCIAAKVNHKLVAPGHPLQSGDQVEILTSHKQNPKPEWEQQMVSAKAKMRLRQALRHLERPLLERGRDAVDNFFRDRGLGKPTNEQLQHLMKTLGYTNAETLYHALGTGAVTLDNIIITPGKGNTAKNLFRKLWRLGTKGGENTKSTETTAPDTPVCEGVLQIEGVDRHGILAAITTAISSGADTEIRSLDIAATGTLFNCTVTIQAPNHATVTALCRTLRSIEGVSRVRRTQP